MIQFPVQHLLDLVRSVPLDASEPQLLASLLVSHELAFYPQAPIGHFFTTVVTDLFLPDAAFFLIEVPEELDSPFIEGETSNFPSEGLLDPFDQDFHNGFNLFILFL